jgi:hypothetical protein
MGEKKLRLGEYFRIEYSSNRIWIVKNIGWKTNNNVLVSGPMFCIKDTGIIGGSAYEEKGWLSNDITLLRCIPATQEEKEWLDLCIENGKVMERPVRVPKIVKDNYEIC